MPGFRQQQLDYKARNGNSVVVMIGDQVIGFAQTADENVPMGADQLFGIGSAKPQEIQQLKFTPNVAITQFALTNKGISLLGYPSTLLEVLANNSFDFHVIDGAGVPLMTFVGCVCDNFSQTVPVNAIITETVNFLAMDVLDAHGTSILNSNSVLQSFAGAAISGIALNTVGL